MHGCYMHAAGCKGEFSLNFPWLEWKTLIINFEKLDLGMLSSELLLVLPLARAVTTLSRSNLEFCDEVMILH